MSGNKFRPVPGHDFILTSPIDIKCKILSPTSLKSYKNEKIGLGFVAAMENSGDRIRSNPIPVTGGDNSGGEIVEMDDILEEYTYVTSHGPVNCYTRVYCDGGRFAGKSQSVCLFHILPAIIDGEKAASDFLSFCHLCNKTLDGEDVYMYRGDEAFCSPECRHRKILMDEHKSRYNNITTTVTVTTSATPNFAVNSPCTNGTKTENRQIFSPGITAV